MRRSTELGMSFLIIENNDSSDKHEWEESKHGSHVEEIDETLILMNQHHFLFM